MTTGIDIDLGQLIETGGRYYSQAQQAYEIGKTAIATYNQAKKSYRSWFPIPKSVKRRIISTPRMSFNIGAADMLRYKSRVKGGGRFGRSRFTRGRGPNFRRGTGAGYTRNVGYYGQFNGRVFPAGELKFHDIDCDDDGITTGGEIKNTGTLNIIPTGTTENTRIGRMARIKQIHMRYTLFMNAADEVGTPVQGNVVRIIFYQDKQCNGVTAAVGDILESANYQSWNNLANKNRFRILMDRTHDCNYTTMTSSAAGTSSNSSWQASFDWHKTCNIPIEYDGVNGSLTETKSNNLCILTISRVAPATSTVTFDSKIRMRFTDS